MWDCKHWLPWRMDGGPAPRNATHPGSKWHHPRLYKTFHFPLSTAAWSWGSSDAVACLRSLHPPAASALGYCMSARAETICSGRRVYCSQCFPVHGALGFLPAASWWHSQRPPRQVSWSLHSLYTGPSVKAGVCDWKLSLEMQNSSQGLPLPPTLFYLGQLPMIQGSHFPRSHCMGKWMRLLHPFQIHPAWAAFVSVHPFTQDLGILDQCKPFLHF